MASDKVPAVGRLYHHPAILTHPNALRQLYLFCKSLCVPIPFQPTKKSIFSLFNPILNANKRARGVHVCGGVCVFANDCDSVYAPVPGPAPAMEWRNSSTWMRTSTAHGKSRDSTWRSSYRAPSSALAWLRTNAGTPMSFRGSSFPQQQDSGAMDGIDDFGFQKSLDPVS